MIFKTTPLLFPHRSAFNRQVVISFKWPVSSAFDFKRIHNQSFLRGIVRASFSVLKSPVPRSTRQTCISHYFFFQDELYTAHSVVCFYRNPFNFTQSTWR